MNKLSIGSTYWLAATGVLFSCIAVTAHASQFRSYISSAGNDSNPCTISQPCRLLPAALLTTANQGEVWILDSANYNTGTVVISQNVTVLSIPEAQGSVLAVNGSDAIQINASVPVSVTLRNLAIRYDAGSSQSGINAMSAGANLIVDHCTFTGALADDITIAGTNPGISATILHSTFQDYIDGVNVAGTASAQASVTMDHVTMLSTVSTSYPILAGDTNLNIAHSRIVVQTPNGNETGPEAIWLTTGVNLVLDDNVFFQQTCAVGSNFAAENSIASTGTNTLIGNQCAVLDFAVASEENFSSHPLQ